MAILISPDLRKRMMRGVASGKSMREVARQFEVAPSTASRLVRHVEATGSIDPRPHGRAPGFGKLGPHHDFLIETVTNRPDITMPQLAAILLERHGLEVAPSSISRVLCALGFTYKKNAAGIGTRAR
jgi:transposase